MVSKRLGRGEGGRRKFLAVIDETPECGRAAAYAARRAKASGGAVVFLYVIDGADFQQWLGVGDIMRAEAMEEAETRMARVTDEVREAVGIEPETLVREGKTVAEIRGLIEADREIAILVLAASDAAEGPGPLVSAVAGSGSAFPVPVTIVPATLTDEDIESLC
ncbi:MULTISPECIES: universal stress protein [Aureimonas]|jgi:nucleotide-binding universal stress UspA family protein|uniref:Nucleotide-binding universal stress UspA family protein n=1 Tax=Aureimonas phyllosphaerae TaxID=1166078 RepID=A0A7W6BZ77_9HYPH|nr:MULTISPECIES: universal stress protein [Aureimonas]KQQ78888.1 universal stress protein UspA [Aureimonas sp. Leaf324]MBB3937465.1 nucleotide-binding universal stress UspA family protein [Aureimonas phyllosphaerae]MBB3961469.1 nucleotide-binding universal stress UspA family protein [Aureimonas phyllosphaerae]SFF38469.1 Universal stress protein family protein [Aureimonas phyllosphaerae]